MRPLHAALFVPIAAVTLAMSGAAVAGSLHDDPAAIGHIDAAISELQAAKGDLTAPPPTVTATETSTVTETPPPVTTTATVTSTVTTTAPGPTVTNTAPGPTTTVTAQPAAPTFGAYNNRVTGDTTANWTSVRPALGGSSLKVARRFNSGLPSACPDAAWARANNVTLAYSVKADPATMASGSLDSTVASLARSMDAGWYLIYYHEPEDNMTGAVFKPAFQQFYRAAKAANPQLRIIYAAMEYQYRLAGKNFADYDPYPYVDGYGLDIYDMDWQANGALDDLSNAGAWVGLHKWLAGVRTHSLPYGFTEWGVEKLPASRTDQVVASYLTRNLSWVKAQGLSLVLYWNGDGMADGGFAIDNRPLSAAAWKAAQ